jgi:hypothetical protein
MDEVQKNNFTFYGFVKCPKIHNQIKRIFWKSGLPLHIKIDHTSLSDRC